MMHTEYRLFEGGTNRKQIRAIESCLRRHLRPSEYRIDPVILKAYNQAIGCHVFLRSCETRDVALRAMKDQFGMEPTRFAEDKYSDEELCVADWAYITFCLGGILDARPHHGTEFDERSACPVCGAGAVQTSPLRVLASQLRTRKKIALADSGRLLISDALAEAWFPKGVASASLRRCEDRESHKPLPWLQILPTETAPRASPKSQGLQPSSCPHCHRGGYGLTWDEPVRLRIDLPPANQRHTPDAMAMWEWFGTTNGPGRIRDFGALQVLLPNPVIRRVVASKTRAVKLTPVNWPGWPTD